MSRRAVLLGLIVAGTLGAGGCGSRPTAPAPAPTPTPAPAPTPEPTPAEVYGCGLPRGQGRGWHCPRLNPTFDAEVEAAIEKVIAEHPDYFDFRRARGGPWSFRVRNREAYNFDVVENLRRMGFCALDDGKEIAVKNDNSFSDQYEIISSDNFIIRGRPSYRATCIPAWDAIPPAGDDS
ncbi:MAG TPA: hypothetical protein VGN09_02315 [Vicinamibacteria bacterium]|jgi:hypothetical protein